MEQEKATNEDCKSEQKNEKRQETEGNGKKNIYNWIRKIKDHEKALKIIIPLIIAIISFVFVSNCASSAEFHKITINTLQAKQDKVLQLSAASAGIAAGASLALGDRATAVSNKILDLTGYFILILSAILLEKYLVTVMGLVSFKILIPISCLLFSLFTIFDKSQMRKLAIRLSVFAIVTFLIIPISVKISNVIEDTYANNINETIQSSNDIVEELNENIENTKEKIDNENREKIEKNNKNILEKIGDMASALKEKVSTSVQNVVEIVTEKAKEIISKLTAELNKLIDAIAVMIVTTCVIPLLVVIFFLWVVKLLFSIDINIDLKKAPKLSNIINKN